MYIMKMAMIGNMRLRDFPSFAGMNFGISRAIEIGK